MKKIIVFSENNFEEAGISFLLQSMGYLIKNHESPICDDDLLIVSLISQPLIGWCNHLSLLKKLRTLGRFKMIAIIPDKLKNVVLIRCVCPVVSEGNSLQELKDNLSYSVDTWERKESARLTPVVLPRNLAFIVNENNCYHDVSLQQRNIYVKLGFDKYRDFKFFFLKFYEPNNLAEKFNISIPFLHKRSFSSEVRVVDDS